MRTSTLQRPLRPVRGPAWTAWSPSPRRRRVRPVVLPMRPNLDRLLAASLTEPMCRRLAELDPEAREVARLNLVRALSLTALGCSRSLVCLEDGSFACELARA